MRCCCCNKNLSDWESTVKSATDGSYLDMCIKCIEAAGIDYVARKDLDKATFDETENNDFDDIPF